MDYVVLVIVSVTVTLGINGQEPASSGSSTPDPTTTERLVTSSSGPSVSGTGALRRSGVMSTSLHSFYHSLTWGYQISFTVLRDSSVRSRQKILSDYNVKAQLSADAPQFMHPSAEVMGRLIVNQIQISMVVSNKFEILIFFFIYFDFR